MVHSTHLSFWGQNKWNGSWTISWRKLIWFYLQRLPCIGELWLLGCIEQQSAFHLCYQTSMDPLPFYALFCDSPLYLFPLFCHFYSCLQNYYCMWADRPVYLCNAWEWPVEEGPTRPARKRTRQKNCIRFRGNSCERQLARSKYRPVIDKPSKILRTSTKRYIFLTIYYPGYTSLSGYLFCQN